MARTLEEVNVIDLGNFLVHVRSFHLCLIFLNPLTALDLFFLSFEPSISTTIMFHIPSITDLELWWERCHFLTSLLVETDCRSPISQS